MNVSRKLKEIHNDVLLASTFTLQAGRTRIAVLAGCFSRAYGFVTLTSKRSPQTSYFFSVASLRAICEDLIALSYLFETKSESEIEEILTSMSLFDFGRSLAKQEAFFKKYRPFQPVLCDSKESPSVKAQLPRVRDMAQAVGLDDVYDFLYAIASDAVHFNPNFVVRNAWGPDKVNFVCDVRHFDDYYFEICRIYGMFLFCLFVERLGPTLGVSPRITTTAKQFFGQIHDELWWPEAVTHVEMNCKPVSLIRRILAQSAYRVKQKSKE